MSDVNAQASEPVLAAPGGSPASGPMHEAEPRESLLASAAAFTGSVALQIGAFLISMALVIALLALLGYSPANILEAMWDGSAGSPVALKASLSQAVPLMLSAIGVWLAFEIGLFNVGADGQLQVGGTAALAVAVTIPGSTPAILSICLAVLAGGAAGAAWAAIAGALKAFRGANEVISTIMLNFVAAAAITILISGPLRAPTAKFSPQTEYIPEGMKLGTLGSGIALIAVIALVASLAAVAVVRWTRLGLRLRAVGLNPDAAHHLGIAVNRTRFLAFSASGALAGLGGALVVLGYRYYIAPGWAPQWGLLGIAIGFLAIRTPFLIPVWAIILGMISAAGPALKAGASVPDSITTLMQVMPVIVLFVLYACGRALRRLRASREAAPATPAGAGA